MRKKHLYRLHPFKNKNMREIKITTSITKRESPSLDKYFKEIGKIDMISEAEEVALAKRIREQGDSADIERLTKVNLRFVVSTAKQYQNRGLTLGDLISEGNFGLIKAAKRFDETKGFKFISYAVWWIRQSILRAIAEQSRIVRLPLNQIGALSKINNATLALENELEREPSLAELSEALDINEDRLGDILRYQYRQASLDAPLISGNDESDTLLNLLPSKEVSPEQSLNEESLGSDLKKALSSLRKKDREILIHFYGIGTDPLKLEALSDKLQMTTESVRQIKTKALNKLSKSSGAHILKSYLSSF
jgi:RNA polymerase primary sigma factor